MKLKILDLSFFRKKKVMSEEQTRRLATFLGFKSLIFKLQKLQKK
jgi:hypothetical protein